MGKNTTQTPKKGSKTKNNKSVTKDTVVDDENDMLNDIDQRIERLQNKKEEKLKVRSSIAVTKGKRKVKSIYATIPPNLSDVETDSGKADNEFETTDDGEIPGTSRSIEDRTPVESVSYSTEDTIPRRKRLPAKSARRKRRRESTDSSEDRSKNRRDKNRRKELKKRKLARYAPVQRAKVVLSSDDVSDDSDHGKGRRKRRKRLSNHRRDKRERFAPRRPANECSTEEDDDLLGVQGIATTLKEVMAGGRRRTNRGIDSATFLVAGATLPLKVKNQIWKGAYVDLSSLLPRRDAKIKEMNIKYCEGNDSQYSVSSTSKNRPPANIAEWTHMFQVYASVYTMRFPDAAPQLFSYAIKIASLQKRDRFKYVWRYYDELFRELKA